MWKSSIEWYNHSVHHWPGRRMARMTQQEIFEILMDGFAWSLEQWHDEKSLWNLSQVSGRYYEWNYECWRFAGYPIHQPDKKKLANAFKDKQGARPAVETDTDSNVADTNPTRAPKQGKRKHNIIESSTSTSSTNSQTEYGKRKVRRRRRPRRSSSSSTSSLPDQSVQNIKCKTCGLWIDAVVFREHKRNHKSPSSSSRLNMQRPERLAKNTVFQKPDYHYY